MPVRIWSHPKVHRRRKPALQVAPKNPQRIEIGAAEVVDLCQAVSVILAPLFDLVLDPLRYVFIFGEHLLNVAQNTVDLRRLLSSVNIGFACWHCVGCTWTGLPGISPSPREKFSMRGESRVLTALPSRVRDNYIKP